jgi:hypothetical protein
MTAFRHLAHRAGRDTSLVASGLVLVAFLALLVPWFFAPGSPMDEGGILAYADRVLHGDVPMRDLHSFYGPLNSYVIALVFKVAGPSLYAERTVGLVYRLVLAAALLALVRRRGAPGILFAGVAIVLLLTSQGVGAFASYAALASSAAAILAADTRRPLAAGALAGLAVLMRFDWILPVVLASLPFLVVWSWRARIRVLAGFFAVAAIYVPYLAIVGQEKARLWLDQLRTGQSGRGLPVPHWPSYPGCVFDLMVFSVVVLAVLGLRRRRTAEGIVYLAASLLGAGLLPYVLVRADRTHIVVGAVVPIAVFAAAAPVAIEDLRALVRPVPRLIVIPALTLVGLFAVSMAIVLTTSASLRAPKSYTVSHDGRTFRIARSSSARAATRTVERTDALASAGGRLFVGPGDLRRTSYADSYLYYLLPRLRPATFFITLDPRSTELRGSRLADQLRRADVVILNKAYDAFSEPNRSSEFGSPEPNRVLRDEFCVRGAFGTFRVYARC